jgi:glycosyltransferase involved in cell wall biosynthesis
MSKTRPRAPRLLFFATGFDEPGGCARHGRTLADGFLEAGWDVTIVARAAQARAWKIERKPGWLRIEVPGFGRRWGAAIYLLTGLATGIFRGWRASFMALQLSATSLAAGTCATLLRRPFVALATSTGENGEIAQLDSPFRRVHRALLARASAVVAQTDAAAGELRGRVGDARISVIPNPVAALDPLPLLGGERVLFAGRFSRTKGVDLLLEAWPRVAEARSDARLVLLGTTHEGVGPGEDFAALVREDPVLRTSIDLPGWVADVLPYYAAADIFVIPSRTEGLSNALLEATALGRVVVASDIPGNRAVLGDAHPLYFRAGDTRALEATLLKALTDPAAREQAVANAMRQRHRFSTPQTVRALSGLLNGSGVAGL